MTKNKIGRRSLSIPLELDKKITNYLSTHQIDFSKMTQTLWARWIEKEENTTPEEQEKELLKTKAFDLQKQIDKLQIDLNHVMVNIAHIEKMKYEEQERIKELKK